MASSKFIISFSVGRGSAILTAKGYISARVALQPTVAFLILELPTCREGGLARVPERADLSLLIFICQLIELILFRVSFYFQNPSIFIVGLQFLR